LKCECGAERERTDDDFMRASYFTCDKCKDKNKEEEKLRESKCTFETNLKNSMIPNMFLKYEDKFKFDGDIKALYCYGGVGTAKTTYLACLGKHLCRFGTVLFIPTVNLLLKAQGVFKTDNMTIEKEFEPYLSVDYLILDDIGVEKVTDFVKQSLYYLINTRYMYEKHIYFSSNLSLEDLGKKFDERISSRISGMCKIKHFKGKDLRI
jgi:DNA replication protein DnaC